MSYRIAAAMVAMLLGLAAPPSRADEVDLNYLEIDLLGYDTNDTGVIDSYGIVFDAGNDAATTCELATPSDTSECPDGIMDWDLSWAQLQAEIGTGSGDDWTLTWDKGLGTETIVGIDFGTVLQSDWFSLPTIISPLHGATGVSPDASIDWDWPGDPDLGGVEAMLYAGDLDDLMSGPLNEACGDEFDSDPPPTTWDPTCLNSGTWTAVVLNENEDLRIVYDGLTISGNWVLDNSEWLAADSIDLSTFTVIPEPSTALLFGLGLVGLVVGARRSAL